MFEEELTYKEHLLAKIKIIEDTMAEVLRNIKLTERDIVNRYGIFSNDFYNRKDISDSKKSIIRFRQNDLEKYLSENKGVVS